MHRKHSSSRTGTKRQAGPLPAAKAAAPDTTGATRQAGRASGHPHAHTAQPLRGPARKPAPFLRSAPAQATGGRWREQHSPVLARAPLCSVGVSRNRSCGTWVCRVPPHFKAFHAERAGLQLQSRPFCCPYPPNRGSIYAQHAREAPEIRGSEDHSRPRLKAFSTFGQSIQRMRSRDCLSANKLPGQRRAP